MWSARCRKSGTPGAGSGPKKRTGRKTSTALRADFHTHVSVAMRALIAARDWLTVIRLPAYAPDLNPTEAVWSHLKRSIGNLAVRGVDHLLAIIKNRLKRIQYRPDLLHSFLTHTGLTLEPDST
ncbi:transposase [Micromonospora sp. KC207]|uniref:transposase n=1 Tax=Micromonospora sp. KC207 TaxID=2530377 RepID=UPI0021103AA2|nr:transposase [Micromonospora sp. KC207]